MLTPGWTFSCASRLWRWWNCGVLDGRGALRLLRLAMLVEEEGEVEELGLPRSLAREVAREATSVWGSKYLAKYNKGGMKNKYFLVYFGYIN